MGFLSYPYEYLIAPVLPGLLSAYALVGLAWLTLDGLAQRRRGGRRGASAALVLTGLLLLLARSSFEPDSHALVGLVLLAHAVALFGLAQSRRMTIEGDDREAPAWTVGVIIALSLGLKCIALEAWPPNLNEYAAQTGLYGIQAVGGNWPDHFWRGKDYDLMNGGMSPLMLPITWMSIRLFGGTVFAVRFAEVAASTVLLVFFWLWVRHHLRGWWGPLALFVFAFSPWHLAQSRMGTVVSISAALALAILWIAERLSRMARPRLGWWIAFGASAGLIAWAYAPLKVLYAFFLVVLAVKGMAARRAPTAAWWIGPTVALAVCVGFVLVQLGGREGFDDMFRYEFGTLATDTSIWHKTPDGEVTPSLQGPHVIAENFFANAQLWFARTYAERTILCWYAPALTLGALLAVVTLVRRSQWVTPLYFLIGMLPPLIIFPLERRSLISWPLVYAVGVAFAREVAQRATLLVQGRWWRVGCRAAVVSALAAASLHGAHLFATTNSVVLPTPYFGPDQTVEMMHEAQRLVGSHHLYFVDLYDVLVPVAEVHLFEPARALGRSGAWGYLYLEELADHVDQFPANEPLCFLYLVTQGEDSAMEQLRAALPGGTLVRRFAGSGRLLYSMYFYDRRHLGADADEH